MYDHILQNMNDVNNIDLLNSFKAKNPHHSRHLLLVFFILIDHFLNGGFTTSAFNLRPRISI